MTKNDLIAMLQRVKGNPTICIWNPHVDDYNHIESELVPVTLVKESREFCRPFFFHETPDATDEDFEKYYRKKIWSEVSPYLHSEKDFEKMYGKNRKTIYVLNLKQRGLVSYGAHKCDDISY